MANPVDPTSSPLPYVSAIPTPTPEPEIVEGAVLDAFAKKFAESGKPVPPIELLKAVQEEVGLEDSDMEAIPLMNNLRWAGATWEVLKPPPGLGTHYVAMMFYGDQADKVGDHTPGDVRIYVAPIAQKNEAGEPLLYYRYTLNRTPNTGAIREVMRLRLFVGEMARELDRIAVAFDVLEDEPEEEEED
jgi:hypothetical protein